MGKAKSYYAVAVGRNPGIYYSWTECEQQVTKYPSAIFKSFNTQSQAEKYIKLHTRSLHSLPEQFNATKHIETNLPAVPSSIKKEKVTKLKSRELSVVKLRGRPRKN